MTTINQHFENVFTQAIAEKQQDVSLQTGVPGQEMFLMVSVALKQATETLHLRTSTSSNRTIATESSLRVNHEELIAEGSVSRSFLDNSVSESFRTLRKNFNFLKLQIKSHFTFTNLQNNFLKL